MNNLRGDDNLQRVSPSRPSRPEPSTLEALDAFYLEHRNCGELDGGVDEVVVWLACERCEVQMVRDA
jgi:hypothetical protein